MDVLGDILRIVRLRGSVYFNACFCSPWGMDVEENSQAAFHLMVKGDAWLRLYPQVKRDNLPKTLKPSASPFNEVINDRLIHLKEGDIVLFPTGVAHMISHAPDGECLPSKQVVDAYQKGDALFDKTTNLDITHSNSTHSDRTDRENSLESQDNSTSPQAMDTSNIVCGYVEFDRSLSHPFLDNLPDIIHIAAETRAQFHWLDSIIKHMVFESANKQPGTDVLVDRFTEVLFIQVLRSYAQLSTKEESYLSALVDTQLSKALSLIHDNPDREWTVDLLALDVGMSRSSFYSRFNNYIGMPPMKYLYEWRMMQAKQKIEGTQKSLSLVAEEVGYQSDSAFQKAFKRFFNFTPASLRKSKK
jgi:AraC-like DNA-binding protein